MREYGFITMDHKHHIVRDAHMSASWHMCHVLAKPSVFHFKNL